MRGGEAVVAATEGAGAATASAGAMSPRSKDTALGLDVSAAKSVPGRDSSMDAPPGRSVACSDVETVRLVADGATVAASAADGRLAALVEDVPVAAMTPDTADDVAIAVFAASVTRLSAEALGLDVSRPSESASMVACFSVSS